MLGFNEPNPPPGWEIVPTLADDEFTDAELSEDGVIRVRRVGSQDEAIPINEAWRLHDAG